MRIEREEAIRVETVEEEKERKKRIRQGRTIDADL